VVDADFTNITSVETLTATADLHLASTLGSAALAAGLVTINMTATDAGTDGVVVGAGYTGTLTVDFDSDAIVPNSVVATGSAATIIVTAADSELDTTVSTITGGSGTSDEIKITSATATALSATDTGSWSAVEKITTVGTGGTLGLITSAGNVAAGETLTVNATSMTATAFTFDGTAETATTPGHFVVTTAGTAAHDITLGGGNDSYTSTNTAGANTVVATGGTNTITTGDGGDGITLGTGVDNVNAGAGNDTITVATANIASTDTIAGGTGTDTLTMSDVSTLVDSDFTLITSVEKLSFGTNAATITLGAASSAAGIGTVTDSSGATSLTVGAGHTGALTVALSTGTDTINASAYTGVLTVTTAGTSITSVDTVTGGTGSSDILSITGTGLADADMAGVTAFETFKVATNATWTVETNDANVAAGDSLTVDAALATTAVVSFDASSETDGTFTITTLGTGAHIIVLGNGSDTYTSTNTAGINTVTATAGNNTITTAAGADIITLGSGSDTVTTGDAADVIKTTSANLNQNDIINAGDGTDSLTLTSDSTVIDSDFTNITNLESIKNTGDVDMTLTLGALAMAAGVTSVTFTGTTSATDSVTISAGFTSALTVNVGPDAAINSVLGSASAATISVAAAGSDLDSAANVLTGGSGSADVILITQTDDTIEIGDTASWSGFEKITTVGTAGTLSLTTSAGNVAAGETLTIDVTSMTNEVFTFVGTAETTTPGHFHITATGGTAARIVTLGSGNDTFISNAGANTVVATAGTNTITTGVGIDIITSGTGTDNITAGATGVNSVLFLDAVPTANTVVITDWTTAYVIDFDISATLESGGNLINFDDGINDAVTASDQINLITSAPDFGALGADENILVINVAAGIANASALEDALEYGGSLAATSSNAVMAVGSRFLVVYDDTVSTYIAMVSLNISTPADSWFSAGSFTAVNIVELTGLATAQSITQDEINYS